jgi:hypothetical protein
MTFNGCNGLNEVFHLTLKILTKLKQNLRKSNDKWETGRELLVNILPSSTR